MFQRVLFIFLMGPPLLGAAATGTSMAILLAMSILFSIALDESSARNEELE